VSGTLGGCGPDWDAESCDGQGWGGLGFKDLFGKKEVIVATLKRPGREPTTWKGRSIGLSKGNCIHKGGGSRKVGQLMQEKTRETLT